MVRTRSNSAVALAARALTLAACMFTLMACCAQAASAAPTVTALNTHAGPTAGGTSVTITGTGFVSGASSVAFGASAATSVVVNSTTSITATSPAEAAATIDVTVTASGATSATNANDHFTYDPAPTITAVAPTGGPTSGGTSVTVTGTGFISGSTTVHFGLLSATPTVTSATSLTVVAPADTGIVDVTATTPGGTSATSSADQYEYDAVPTVSSVSPTAGPTSGGSSVTITGSGFVSGSTTVAFGAGHPASSVVVNSATSITATSPAQTAGTIDVLVTTPGGTSSVVAGDKYAVDPVPVITTVSVAAGPVAGGTSVTITGSNFVTGASAVSFGGTPAASMVVNSATSITAVSPAEPAAMVDIAVTTPGGTSGSVAGDRFTFDPIPVVSAVTPGGGPLTAGTSVTVTGSGFVSGSTSVAFGTGHAGTSVSVSSSTSLTVTAPAESVGTIDLTVTTPGGTSATGPADRYAYDAVPTVSSVSPTAGPTSGGTSVTITGTNFVSGSTTVAFGAGHPASNVVVNSATSITATSPVQPAGTVDVLVTTPGGTSAVGAGDKYAVDAVPVVSAVSVTAGPIGGGTSVTITGSNFVSGVTTVAFGGTPAVTMVVNSVSSITATSPASAAGTVDITVTTPGGTSATGPGDRFAFDPVPDVSGVSPGGGPTAGGTSVTVSGSGFVPGSTTVAFGTGHAGTGVTVNSATSLTVTSPAESVGSVDLTVTTPGGTSAVGAADRFGYDPVPTVSSVSPTAGPTTGGTSVTITGSGFVSGSTSVAFGTGHTAAGVVVNSATSITATSPVESAGSVDVVVSTPGGISAVGAGDKYAVDPVPAVTALSVSGGPLSGGTSVTITGLGFITGGTSVSFGTTPATTVTVNSATSITAIAPPEGAGSVDITITTLGGTSATGAADRYTFDPIPSVSAVAPTAGPLGGGSPITISGSGFVPGATTVVFGTGHPSTSVVVNSSSSLTVSPPSGSAGTVDVTVTTPGGTSGAGFADKFSYDPAPTVTSIGPTAGPALGGTTVTITGTNFIAGQTSVSFGAGAPAANVAVTSSTSATAVSPRTAPGTVDVSVTTPGGTSATSTADRFTLAPTPVVSALTATGGPVNGGTSVTITGVGFISGATSVSFGSTPATKVTFNNPTSVTATAPAEAAGTVDVTVSTVNGTSPAGSADQFTYDPVPTVIAISPAAGPTGGGSRVAITGSGFVSGATSVSFGAGHPAGNLTVTSPTLMTASPPPGSGGIVDVTVTTPGGTSFISPADEFTYAAPPTFSAITPTTGTVAGGTAVTITGSNFIAGETTVLFGTVAATNVTVSATSLTATAPAASNTGTVDVTVSTPSGVSTISSADTFTYTPVPIIDGVNPYAGVPAGGTTVRIYGANLEGASGVMFGSTPATSFKAVSSGEVTAVSPKRPAGSVTVTVITPLGPTPAVHAATFAYASAPVTTGRQAGGVVPTQALLRGRVSSHGLPLTRCQFELGRTTHYTERLSCARTATPSAIAAAATVAGLRPATTYHFRLLASTEVGTSTGKDEQFTTPQLPTVAAAQIRLQVKHWSDRAGDIGKLVAVGGITGAAAGETIRVVCQLNCAPHLVESVPAAGAPRPGAGRAAAAPRWIALTQPLLLSATTQIQVNLTLAGKLSRYTRYTFTPVGTGVTARVVVSGCLAASGSPVPCRAPTPRHR